MEGKDSHGHYMDGRDFKLKRCPFCGGKAQMGRTDPWGSLPYIYCTRCGARTDNVSSAQGKPDPAPEAVRLWNQRV